jgi:tetratricopeptide (TPR) repeat protein
LQVYGVLAHWTGNHQRACEYYEEAHTIFEKLGDQLNMLWSQNHMAHTLLRQGDISKAKEIFEYVIERFQKADHGNGVIYAIEGVASMSVNQNQLQRAAQLFAWTDAERKKVGDSRPPIEQGSVDKDLEVIKSQLTEKEFAESLEIGRTMTTEQAIALALEE